VRGLRLEVRRPLGLAIGAALFAGEAFAQQETAPPAMNADGAIQDIVVTARRREERLQETPVAVSALPAQSLERLRIDQPDKLQNLVPNLASQPMPSVLGGSIAFIRGVGAQELLLSVDSPVGTYIDGVYVARNVSANLNLVSPARIEVLRGPQGTLFGRNTSGGAISITTPTPKEGFAVELKGGASSFAERYGQVRMDTGAIGESGLSALIAYQHRERHGYVDNPAAPSNRDPGALNAETFFGKLHGQWGGLTADYSFDYTDLRGQALAFQIGYATDAVKNYYGQSPSLGGNSLVVDPHYRDVVPLQPTDRQHTRAWGHALTLQLDLTDQIKIKSITGYRKFKGRQPVAFAPGGMLGRTTTGIAAVTPFAADDDTFRRQHQFSQEVQLLGSFRDFNFVAGGYYFKEKGGEIAPTYFTVLLGPSLGLNLTSATNADVSARSLAGFAQASVKPAALDGKLEITAGIRYTSDRKQIDQTRPVTRADTRSYENVSYNVSLGYQVTGDALLYARIGTGYRSGGFNARAGTGVSFVFKPEKVRTYEGGFKTDWLGRRLRLNGAGFYTEYDNLQVNQYTGTSGAGGSGFTRNANAHISGFELEAIAAPARGLTLNGSVGYVKAVFDQLAYPAPGTGVLTNYASVSHFPYVPKWTTHVGGQYDLPEIGAVKPALLIDYSWRSGQYFFPNSLLNPFNDQIRAKGYGLLNGSIVLSAIPLGDRARAEITLWTENLLDRHYRIQGVDFGALGFAGNVYGVPRRLGVDLKISY